MTVPDTITEWKLNAFCVADIGFGLSEQASLTVFQPFFVDPLLPYSVVRGETLHLKATVFNYLKDCIQVRVHVVKAQCNLHIELSKHLTSCGDLFLPLVEMHRNTKNRQWGGRVLYFLSLPSSPPQYFHCDRRCSECVRCKTQQWSRKGFKGTEKSSRLIHLPTT